MGYSPLGCKESDMTEQLQFHFLSLYGGVNGDLLQEALCHTQVCCTQSPCPFSRPLLIRNSTEDTQTLAGLAQTLWGPLVSTRFCLSPLSISGGYGV